MEHIDMSVSHTGICKLKIETTNENFEISPDEIQFEEVSSEDRGMGSEITHEAEHEIKSEIDGKTYNYTWTVSEYPIGVLNHFDGSGHNIETTAQFEIAIIDDDGPYEAEDGAA